MTAAAMMIPELRNVLKRLHYPLEVMLVCARWYAAYPLSFGKTPSPRHLEEMMQERGVFVDHSTVHRWALKILPVMALIFRRRKRPTLGSTSSPRFAPLSLLAYTPVLESFPFRVCRCCLRHSGYQLFRCAYGASRYGFSNLLDLIFKLHDKTPDFIGSNRKL